MPKLAANLSFLFQELPFLDRFGAAAEAGFRGVECLFPYDTPAAAIAEQLERHRLAQVLLNLPPGDMAAGERGLAALPGRAADFMTALDTALAYARATGCRRLHALSGVWPADRPKEEGEAALVANLRRAADRVAADGITLLIEPINPRDVPGYFLNTTRQALAILDRVARDNVKLQLDLYHCQITEGDLATRLGHLAAATPTSRSPAFPTATSPTAARSTTPISSISSTRSATTAGSAANTGPPPARSPASVGRGAGASAQSPSPAPR
jgi:hydroxypyruvate isomerase